MFRHRLVLFARLTAAQWRISLVYNEKEYKLKLLLIVCLYFREPLENCLPVIIFRM